METSSHVGSDIKLLSGKFWKKSPSLVEFHCFKIKKVINMQSRRGQNPSPPPPPPAGVNRVNAATPLMRRTATL